jgi:hypothetical protein
MHIINRIPRQPEKNKPHASKERSEKTPDQNSGQTVQKINLLRFIHRLSPPFSPAD